MASFLYIFLPEECSERVGEEKKDKKGSLLSYLFGSQKDVTGYSNLKLRLTAYFHIYKYFLMFFVATEQFGVISFDLYASIIFQIF